MTLLKLLLNLRCSRNVLAAICVLIINHGGISGVFAEQLQSPDELEKSAIKREVERLVESNEITEEQSSTSKKEVSGKSRGSKRIVNGISTVRYAPAGALLKGRDRKSASAWCSGTLIGCNTFLTAAHCFDDYPNTPMMDNDPDPKNYKVFFQSGGFFDVKEIHYKRNEFNFPDADVAVVKLSKAVERISPLPINTSAKPQEGTTGLIVGFGRTGGLNNDYGIKRLGSIKTAHCTGSYSNTTLVCWNYDSDVGPAGEDSNTCNGDSGGGLYVQNQLIVAGVTSGGVRSSCLTDDHSYDANVFHYHDWIEQVGGQDISRNACGVTPAIDEDQHIKGAIETLSANAPEASYPVDVPQDTASFRVAMNGEDNGGSNFDLYLIPGSTTDLKQAACTEDGSGQFGYCEITDPTPGPWTILVRRKKGKGLVQVTVTILPENQS